VMMLRMTACPCLDDDATHRLLQCTVNIFEFPNRARDVLIQFDCEVKA
jgi:hypothetical protein